MVCDFRLLGPVQVRLDGRALPAGSGRERFLLTALLLNADRLTPVTWLIDALWADPPPTARAQLHNMVSKWRRRLGAEGPRLIATRPLGYELILGDHRLDLLEFRRLAECGRRAAADDPESAARQLARALGLWRGPALADVPDELVAGHRQALHDEQLAVRETLLDVQLALGRHDEILRSLPAMLAEHPYRERLYETEMLALVGAGRRADALEVYRRLHRRLVDELGVEPSSALTELQRQILDGEEPDRTPAGRTVPRQLPARITPATGRAKLIGAIRTGLADGDAPPVAVLVGLGGVGKTTLALSLGHELADRFPDGQLYADLGGSKPHPADPHDVAGRFLRAIGVPGPAVPDDRDERTGLYRSRLAGRAVLLVLDDARDEEQVRPLLPGTASCTVLVTSRRQLAALVGATSWTVPVFAPSDSMELLGRLVGIERIAVEPEAASAIADASGHLPLAVAIAAARLASRPDWTLGEFAGRLADERGRLDELAVGDLDVRASIGLSYRALDPHLRVAFRRLGLLAAPDWPAWVLRPLCGGSPLLLDQLVAVHLVEPRGRDAAGQLRFGLHDLVAGFARERCHAEDSPAERAEATTRLVSAWLALAAEADRRLAHDVTSADEAPEPAVPPDDAAALLAGRRPLDWFEAERTALVAAVEQAAGLGEAELAGRLALRMRRFLKLRGYQDDRERALQTALAGARGRVGDRLLARLLDALFLVRAERARAAGLADLATELVAVAGRLGDRQLKVSALGKAGMAARRAGRLQTAAAWFDQAIAAGRDAPAGPALVAVLNGRAKVHSLCGEHDAAVALSTRAVALARQHAGPSLHLALSLTIHGDIRRDAGLLDGAENAYTQAAAITRGFGYQAGTATLDGCLGQIDLRRGRWQAATVRLARALRYQEAHGDPDDLADVLDSLGDLAILHGVPASAVAPLRRALDLRRRIGAPLETAGTLARLALAGTATGDHRAAAAHRRECRAILDDLGLDETSLRLPQPPAVPVLPRS